MFKILPQEKKNRYWLIIQYLIRLLFGLAGIKINLLHYGNEQFGYWLLLLSIWGLGSAIDLGFGTTIVKFVSQHKRRQSQINKIISSSILLYVILGLIIVIIGIIISEKLYQSNRTYLGETSDSFYQIVILLAMSFYLQYLSQFFRSIFEGLSKFSLTSKIIIVQNVIQLGGVILLYLTDLSIQYLALLYLLNSFLLIIWYILLFKYKLKGFSIKFNIISIDLIRSIFSFSFPIQFSSVVQAAIDPAMKYIVGNYYSVEAISLYEIAKKIAQSSSGLFFNAYKSILPEVSRIEDKDELTDYVQFNLLNYCNIGIIYSGLTFGIMLFPISVFLNVLFPMKGIVLIFLILALPEAINTFGFPIYNYFLGIGKVNILAIFQLLNFLLMISFSVLGFVISDSPIGLLGYFMSVSIVNIMMVRIIIIQQKVNLLLIIKRISLRKLLFLICMILTAIIVNLFYNSWLLSIIGLISLSSLFIFYSSIKSIADRNLIPFMNKRVS
jgi:O-antigen/teichoic acid export membrane protein